MSVWESHVCLGGALAQPCTISVPPLGGIGVLKSKNLHQRCNFGNLMYRDVGRRIA